MPVSTDQDFKLTMLGGLDGCEIRTGIFKKIIEEGRKPQWTRTENWREVRTGFVRPLEEIIKTYVCKMTDYPDICHQLYQAAQQRGLKNTTSMIAVGDGGNGLYEELSSHFNHFQYILDHRHLESHFYETAESLEIESPLRAEWVKNYMNQLWENKAKEVIQQLQLLYADSSHDRLRRLIDYVTRFQGSVDYGKYKKKGWPVGSGEVESAHRYIPQERLKIAGACWHPNTINPLLSLRVIRANGWWKDFWNWHKHQPLAKAA